MSNRDEERPPLSPNWEMLDWHTIDKTGRHWFLLASVRWKAGNTRGVPRVRLYYFEKRKGEWKVGLARFSIVQYDWEEIKEVIEIMKEGIRNYMKEGMKFD